MRWLLRRLLPLCLLASGPAALADDKADRILLDARRYEILTGRHSTFAAFQTALQKALTECGDAHPPLIPAGQTATGRIGADTRRAIQNVLACPVASSVPPTSPARQGVITEQLWLAIMADAPIPSALERANALVLSFEATDFGDPPEWNLCQDGSGTDAAGRFFCVNASDPCSYLTWGPRGATAGVGREIQFVLWQLAKQNPELLRSAFGAEYGQLDRFFRLKSGVGDACGGPIPLKIFMCAIWRTPQRRALWNEALTRLGNIPDVRREYTELYAANEFDGGKLRDFYAMWKELGLTPSEVDYAFFLDRVTHLGGPPDATDDTFKRLTTCIKGERGAVSRNGSARRCLSKMQKHPTQAGYRMARDVAYYLDSYKEGALGATEVDAWAKYVPISAVHNFGLRDDIPFVPEPPMSLATLGIDLPNADALDVTPEEVASCPASVISPLQRAP